MRVPFSGDLPSQRGSGHPYFQGTYTQRGHGIGSFLKGLLKAVLPVAQQAGKRIARQAVRTGANTLTDFIDGNDGDTYKPPRRAPVRRRRRQPVRRTQRGRGQKGRGLGRRVKTPIKRRRKAVPKSLTSRGAIF